MKIYDLIKQLLTEHSELRDSDKKLYWGVCFILGYLKFRDGTYTITREAFLEAPSTETIRRCRQKIQQLHPELQGTKKIKEARTEKAKEKGTFIFREQMGLV